MDRIVIPEYQIPPDLEKVLNKDLKYYDGISNESRLYLHVLQALKNAKSSIDIKESHYILLLKLALFLEERQYNVDMKKYELFNVPIVRPNVKSNTFQITVEEIDEEKPWIRPYDLVDIIDIKSNVCYTLKVTYIQQNNITASDENTKLGYTHNEYKLYNVKFRYQNYPLRCNHFALSRIRQQEVTTYLFPSKQKSYLSKDLCIYNDIKVLNPSIESNPEQKQAVIHILNKSSFPAPYILYGPPGTGKTATLIEAICQIYNGCSKQRILVCTPSNTAADEIARRLLTFIPPSSIYRIYSQSKETSTIDEMMRLCSNYEGGKIVHVKKELIEKKRIVITTLCNCMRLMQLRLDPSYFSHVIIDEAGQCTEADILIPFTLVCKSGEVCSQIVVAGDPQQLGPTVMSKLAETVLGRSILERLMSYDIYQRGDDNKYNPKYITKLLINYRSHPSIVQISNELFYENELISQFDTTFEKDFFPILFYGLKGREAKYYYSPSSCNHEEIEMVLDYVDQLIENRSGLVSGAILPEDIGIVTPFALQSKIIKKKLKNKHLDGINVGTVELFQGQERKVIIMSTVRSKAFFHEGQRHIGFLSSPKRFNVAVTRAQNLLIVVGNPAILQIDYKWHNLLKYCMDNNSYYGEKFSLNSLTDKQNVEKLTIVESSKLFDPRVEKDLWKFLDKILYPEAPVLQKLKSRAKSKNYRNNTISKSAIAQNYHRINSEEKNSWRCEIL